MNYLSEYIKKESKDVLGININVVEKRRTFKDMEKELFVECVKTLQEVDERSTFLIDEIGINAVSYEDKFFLIIENLLKLRFNEDQLEVIQAYLHKEKDENEVTILIKGEEKDFDFETASDLYKIVTALQN